MSLIAWNDLRMTLDLDVRTNDYIERVFVLNAPHHLDDAMLDQALRGIFLRILGIKVQNRCCQLTIQNIKHLIQI